MPPRNLLILMSDEHNARMMGCAGHPLAKTPNLDALAARGTRFVDAYTSCPICVPARASLLSGQYAHNHGAVTINGVGGGVQAFDQHRTLPVWLQRAGYRTMFVGKYLNGYGEQDAPTYVPPGWSSWHATVDPTTYNFVKPTVNTSEATIHIAITGHMS